ncbi:ATP-binding protein [Elusimicrobiota bacterium]
MTKTPRNPFIYGKEVGGKEFCNRKKEIADLLSDIRSGQNVIIYSPRRYGKTSLIKETLKAAEKEGIISVFTDLDVVLREEDFVSTYATAIARSFKGPIEKALDALKGIFKTIRPKIAVNARGETELGVEFHGNVNLMTEDVAQAVKTYSDKLKKRIVVVFDEFQQIGVFQTDKIERKLRSIIQTHGSNISYIFMGSKKHLFNNMFSNPNRPFYKIGRHFPLRKITEDELVRFITGRFSASGKRISQDSAGYIAILTECHPYYVQHLSSSVWKLADSGIDRNLVNEALEITIAEEKSAYLNLWDALSLNQKKVLRMLAKEGKTGRIYSHDISRKYDITATTIQKTVKSLMEKDILDKSNGSYEISDVFFRLWLTNIPHE